MIEITFRFNSKEKTAEITWLEETTPSNPVKNLIIPKIKSFKGDDYVVVSINLCFPNCLRRGCPYLESITFPDSIVEIVRQDSFGYSPNLREVIFDGDGIEKLSRLCFRRCKKLKTVKLGNKLTTLPYGIFEGCSSLENIELPNTLENIHGCSFYQCTNLNNIVIPSSVKYIEEYSFVGCRDLHGNISFEGPCPKIQSSKTYPKIFPKHSNDDYNKIHIKPEYSFDYFTKGYFKKYKLIPEKADQLILEKIEEGKYKVIPNLDKSGNNQYTGKIYVPKFIIINNELVEIVEVSDFSFAFCSDLEFVEIDENIKLGNYVFLSSPKCQEL